MRDKIKKWYEQGLWTADKVADAVAKGVISTFDYYEITGSHYTEGIK